jgi:hypothetical protein
LSLTAGACGGRTLLDPGENDAHGSATAGSSSTPARPGGGGSDPGVPSGGTETTDPGVIDPGVVAPEAMPGSGGTGSTGPIASGGTTTGPDGFPITPSPDANCTPSNAKGGMACTVPCATTCGYYDMGTKSCDCVNGVFVSCHCPRPWNYQGRTTAPPCNTVDGRTHWIDNNPCTEEWAQCIGSDPVSGVNPRGCVCLTDPVNGKLEWTCGSTNRWFVPE